LEFRTLGLEIINSAFLFFFFFSHFLFFSTPSPPPRPCSSQTSKTGRFVLTPVCPTDPPINPLEMATLPGSHFLQTFPLANSLPLKYPFLAPPPSLYAVDLCCLSVGSSYFSVPCSRSTRMFARNYFSHDNLACYFSRQFQSGVGLRIIHHRNLLRIPLRRRSSRRRGRRASPSRSPLRLWRSAFCR
jgi:hypothetical protein